MNQIEVRSPSRVDLAGGTVDLWPLYLFVGGAKTVNLAIDVYTQALIEPLDDSTIELVSHDLSLKKKFKNIDSCLREADSQLKLLQVQLKYWRPERGFRLTTQSQSPVGAGIGASSSLTVTLMKSFSKFCKKNFDSIHALVEVAHNLEAEILNSMTGTQDYYPAATGGLNILEYTYSGIRQEVIDFDYLEFNKHFVLVYTGRAHNSGINNFEVVQKAVSGCPDTLATLAEVRDISNEMASVCKQQNFSALPRLFEKEYDARLRLARSFASPEIQEIFKLTQSISGSKVKICGAGGGGCVMIWTNPSDRERVQDLCRKAGFQVLNAKAVAPLIDL